MPVRSEIMGVVTARPRIALLSALSLAAAMAPLTLFRFEALLVSPLNCRAPARALRSAMSCAWVRARATIPKRAMMPITISGRIEPVRGWCLCSRIMAVPSLALGAARAAGRQTGAARPGWLTTGRNSVGLAVHHRADADRQVRAAE